MERQPYGVQVCDENLIGGRGLGWDPAKGPSR
jgi:hypothetical protein